jgi:hypothetical protein
MRERTLFWIYNFQSIHPQEVVNNTYELVQPTIDLREQQFPALPLPRPVPVVTQAPINKLTKKASKTRESQTEKSSAATQKGPDSTQNIIAHEYNIANPGQPNGNLSSSAASSSKNVKANSSNPLSRTETQTTAQDNQNNPWARPLKLRSAPPNGHILSTSPPKSIGGSADDSTELAEQQALLDQEILDTSHGDWKECHCDQCYEEHKEECSKHKGECEDCEKEHMNHEMLDRKMMESWEILERKLLADEEICKLCRWKRDRDPYIHWYPFERARRGVDEDPKEIGKRT